MNSRYSEPEFDLAAIRSDPDQLKQRLFAHAETLRQYIHAKLGVGLQAHISADDVLQETFIQALKDIDRCEATSPASFVAWLKGISNHRLQDIAKSLKRKKRGGDMRRVDGAAPAEDQSRVDFVAQLSAHISTPSRFLARQEMATALRLAVASLPEDQRQAVLLRYLESRDVSNIAEKLGRTPAAVRGLLKRALEALRTDVDRSAIWLSRR